MNAGLVDAHELAWRLKELLKGDRSSDVLATYEPERLAEIEALLKPETLDVPEGAEEWVRRLWPNIVSSIPATGKQLETLLAQLG